MNWLLEPCPDDCADCAFDTHEEPSWDFTGKIPAREYFAVRRARLNQRRATPFVGDIQSREIFETVATLDYL